MTLLTNHGKTPCTGESVNDNSNSNGELPVTSTQLRWIGTEQTVCTVLYNAL